jgi:dipeptidyl-peptidase-4
MKSIKYFVLLFLIATSLISAQTKTISLNEIWSGEFRTNRLDALHSMKNGQQYSVLNFDRTLGTTSVDIYDYKTLKKESTLVSSANLKDIKYFTNYTFSDDESQVLLATDEESIFRHSTLGTYYVFNTKTNEVTRVADSKIQEPTFSPDGKKIAYGYQNNLYVKDLASGQTTQITFDGKKNTIINGITDWVYEEEFAFVRAFEWNANSDRIAFIRFV